MDGTGWTLRDGSASQNVVFDEGAFIENPGYDRGHGIRLRGGWPDKLERASYTQVATVPDAITRIAFGTAPESDYVAGRVPSDLASCLSL